MLKPQKLYFVSLKRLKESLIISGFQEQEAYLMF